MAYKKSSYLQGIMTLEQKKDAEKICQAIEADIMGLRKVNESIVYQSSLAEKNVMIEKLRAIGSKIEGDYSNSTENGLFGSWFSPAFVNAFSRHAPTSYSIWKGSDNLYAIKLFYWNYDNNRYKNTIFEIIESYSKKPWPTATAREMVSAAPEWCKVTDVSEIHQRIVNFYNSEERQEAAARFVIYQGNSERFRRKTYLLFFWAFMILVLSGEDTERDEGIDKLSLICDMTVLCGISKEAIEDIIFFVLCTFDKGYQYTYKTKGVPKYLAGILELYPNSVNSKTEKANFNGFQKANEKSENEVFNKCVLEIAQMLNNHPVLHEKKAFKIKYLCVLQLFVQKYSKEDLWANAVLHLYYKNMLDRSSLYNNINFQEWLGDVMSVPANSKEITSYRGWLVADCILMNAYFDESKGEKIVSEIAEVAKGRYKQEVYEVYRFLYSGDASTKNVNIDQYLKDCWNKNRNYQAMKPIKIIVTANMSAGKSTLLNALIGKKVNKTQNDACTAKIHYLMNKPYEDGFCYEWDYLLKLDADDQILMEDNEDNVNDEIAVGTYFQSLASHNKRLWFIDTPGVNSFQDKEHKEVAEKTIHSTDADMLIYVLNGENIGTEDDKKHLLFVLKNYTGRILFLVNKLDRFRSKEDSVPDTINTVLQDLSDMGFKNPEVLPVSAYAAYLAKMKILKGNLDEDEQDDFELLVRKLRKKEYQFDTYFPESTQKNFKMEYDDDEYQLLYHSGIMHLENIIYNVR